MSDYFTRGLSSPQTEAALSVLMFYAGVRCSRGRIPERNLSRPKLSEEPNLALMGELPCPVEDADIPQFHALAGFWRPPLSLAFAGRRSGLTATAVCSLALAPPRVLASINICRAIPMGWFGEPLHVGESLAQDHQLLADARRQTGRRGRGIVSFMANGKLRQPARPCSPSVGGARLPRHRNSSRWIPMPF